MFFIIFSLFWCRVFNWGLKSEFERWPILQAKDQVCEKAVTVAGRYRTVVHDVAGLEC